MRKEEVGDMAAVVSAVPAVIASICSRLQRSVAAEKKSWLALLMEGIWVLPLLPECTGKSPAYCQRRNTREKTCPGVGSQGRKTQY